MIDTSGSLLDRARARVGQTLRAKWRLDKLLGVGGMAAVYAGTHRNGARAAIKILHLALSLDPDVRQRFLREGYIANTVDHPGAVRVLDDDVAEDGCAFLVMELLDGVSLDGHAERRGGKLPYPEVLAIAGKLLEVLSAAHGKGIVHRDIKPDNVFLTREGSLKLLDFGIARLAGATSGKQTAEGSAFGTPAFMAPEQALGRVREIDARTDLWAVGATMFSLLSGREVHLADTVPALLVAHASQHAPPLASVTNGIPAEVARVVDCALAFDKTRRWPSASAMRDAILAAQAALRLPMLAPVATHQALSQFVTQQTFPALSAPQGATVAPSVTAVPRTAGGRSGVLLGTMAGVLFVVGAIVLFRFALGGSPDASASAAASASPVASANAEPSATVATTADAPATSASAAPVVTPAPEPAASSATAKPSATAPRPAAAPRHTPPPPRGKPPTRPSGDSWLDRQH